MEVGLAKYNAIICDLDGTLCNNKHRKHYIEGSTRNFDKFNAECGNDTVNKWCSDILYLHSCFRNTYILLVSGREAKYEAETRKWLKDNDIPFDHLFMRGIKDYRADHLIKKEIYDKHIKDNFEISFVIDDRQQVVDMWRGEGLTVLQCAEGNF